LPKPCFTSGIAEGATGRGLAAAPAAFSEKHRELEPQEVVAAQIEEGVLRIRINEKSGIYGQFNAISDAPAALATKQP